eukprot:scaffold740_cov246-Chaetoceros_neogracile.AAC.6
MENPDAKYEEWIRELHPDNAEYADAEIIDHRFYAEDSDHRHIWNEHVEHLDGCEYKRVKPKQVHPRLVHYLFIPPKGFCMISSPANMM